MKRLPVVAPRLSDVDDELTHVVCCHDDDIALCGTDLSDTEFVDDDDHSWDCVVCVDLEHGAYCPRGLTCPIFDELDQYEATR